MAHKLPTFEDANYEGGRWNSQRVIRVRIYCLCHRLFCSLQLGAILTKTEKLLPAHQPPIPPSDSDIMEEEEDEEDLPAEIKIAEASRTFDSFVVWGHESLPDSTSDPHVKGIEEWISFAEKACFATHIEYRVAY